MALCSGFGQFGAVAALGDVAKSFGQTTGGTFVQQAGLSASELGVGLAILRLASIGALPLSGLADRIGRRPVLIVTCAVGLLFTMLAAASPGYWWFVVIFALGRPLLSRHQRPGPGGGGRGDRHRATGPGPWPWWPPATGWAPVWWPSSTAWASRPSASGGSSSWPFSPWSGSSSSAAGWSSPTATR